MAVADGGLRQEPRGLCAGQYRRRCAAARGVAATTAGFKGKRASGRKSQFGERCAGVRLRSRCFLGDACSLWLACRNHPFAHDHVATPLPWSANARYGSRLTRHAAWPACDPRRTFPLTVPGSWFELRSGGRSLHRPSLNAKPDLFTAGVLNGMKNPNRFTYPAKPILREPATFCAARLAKL